MKICLINNLYKPYSRGGAEQIVELIVGGLEKQGHEVFVITTKPVGRRRTALRLRSGRAGKQKVYYINAIYYNLGLLPKFLRLFWHLADMFDVGSYFKVKSILKHEKPDVVMIHNLKGIGFLIPRIIKSFAIKHIHTLHDIQLLHPSGLMIFGKEKKADSFLAKIYQSICRWLFTYPNIVISPSNWLMQMHTLRGFFPNARKEILPNPAIFNSTSFNSTSITSKGEKVRKKGIFLFLYVGQIEEHKGILFLIKVFDELCDEVSKGAIQLIIIGNGTSMKRAKKLAAGNNNIKLLGRLTNSKVKDYMQNASCLVVPSLCYENSPTVIYEALSMGLPVIASHLGGIVELIHQGGGILFKPNNEGDLMYQMKWAIDHSEELQEIARKGETLTKELNLNNYIDKLLKLV